jgi:hypothetical protein
MTNHANGNIISFNATFEANPNGDGSYLSDNPSIELPSYVELFEDQYNMVNTSVLICVEFDVYSTNIGNQSPSLIGLGGYGQSVAFRWQGYSSGIALDWNQNYNSTDNNGRYTKVADSDGSRLQLVAYYDAVNKRLRAWKNGVLVFDDTTNNAPTSSANLRLMTVSLPPITNGKGLLSAAIFTTSTTFSEGEINSLVDNPYSIYLNQFQETIPYGLNFGTDKKYVTVPGFPLLKGYDFEFETGISDEPNYGRICKIANVHVFSKENTNSSIGVSWKKGTQGEDVYSTDPATIDITKRIKIRVRLRESNVHSGKTAIDVWKDGSLVATVDNPFSGYGETSSVSDEFTIGAYLAETRNGFDHRGTMSYFKYSAVDFNDNEYFGYLDFNQRTNTTDVPNLLDPSMPGLLNNFPSGPYVDANENPITNGGYQPIVPVQKFTVGSGGDYSNFTTAGNAANTSHGSTHYVVMQAVSPSNDFIQTGYWDENFIKGVEIRGNKPIDLANILDPYYTISGRMPESANIVFRDVLFTSDVGYNIQTLANLPHAKNRTFYDCAFTQTTTNRVVWFLLRSVPSYFRNCFFHRNNPSDSWPEFEQGFPVEIVDSVYKTNSTDTRFINNNVVSFINSTLEITTPGLNLSDDGDLYLTNVVTNTNGGLNYNNSAVNVDFTGAYVDASSNDFRIEQAFADANLTGSGFSGTNISEWSWGGVIVNNPTLDDPVNSLNPTFRWKLNSNPNDSGPSNYNANNSGSTVYTGSIIPYLPDDQAFYSASNDHQINVPNDSRINTSTRVLGSMSIWFKADGYPNGNADRNIYEQGGGTNWISITQEDADVVFGIGEGNANRSYVKHPININQTYHVFVSFNALQDRMAMWVDGVLIGEQPMGVGANLSAHSGDVSIGGASDARQSDSTTPHESFLGSIQDFSYWSEIELRGTEASEINAWGRQSLSSGPSLIEVTAIYALTVGFIGRAFSATTLNTAVREITASINGIQLSTREKQSNSYGVNTGAKQAVAANKSTNFDLYQIVNASPQINAALRDDVSNSIGVNSSLRDSANASQALNLATREGISEVAGINAAFKQKLERQITTSASFREYVQSGAVVNTSFTAGVQGEQLITFNILESATGPAVISNIYLLGFSLSQQINATEAITTTLRNDAQAQQGISTKLREIAIAQRAIDTALKEATESQRNIDTSLIGRAQAQQSINTGFTQRTQQTDNINTAMRVNGQVQHLIETAVKGGVEAQRTISALLREGVAFNQGHIFDIRTQEQVSSLIESNLKTREQASSILGFIVRSGLDSALTISATIYQQLIVLQPINFDLITLIDFSLSVKYINISFNNEPIYLDFTKNNKLVMLNFTKYNEPVYLDLSDEKEPVYFNFTQNTPII